MPWRQRILLIVLLLLVALALLWAFLPRAVPVETAKVSRGPLRVTVEEGGTPRDTREQGVPEAGRASAAKGSAEEAADVARHELEGAKAALTRAGASAGPRPAKGTGRCPAAGH